jgi:RimJ/RimL family protein N-acetyltransferase
VPLIPRVETERLLLRELRGSDIDVYAAMYADPEVTRFLGGPVDRPEAWRRMAVMAGHWLLRGYGNWALERRSDGRMVGRAGLWQPEGWPGLEIGWTLAREAWGHGYATEAAHAARDWARVELGARELISIIATENAASRRVAERLGMTVREEGPFRGERVAIYAG